MPPQDQTPNTDNPSDEGSVINVSTPGDSTMPAADATPTPDVATGVDPLSSPAPADPSSGESVAVNVSSPGLPSFDTPAETTPAEAAPAETTPPAVDAVSMANEPNTPSPVPEAPAFGSTEPAPAAGEPVPAPADPNAPTPVVAPVPGAHPDGHKKSGKKTLLIVAVIGVLFIVVLLVVVLIASSSSKHDDMTDMTTSSSLTTTSVIS